MRVKTLKRDVAEAGADSELPRITGRFICIDPSQRHLVYDFLADFNQGGRESALVHLRLCLHCRELAQALLEIKSGHCLHAGEELVPEAAGPSGAEAGEGESYDQIGEGDREIDSYA